MDKITTGLAFSGGKDSWACLLLNRARLDEILVMWVDAGKNYPELLASVEKAKAMSPNFLRIPSDRDGQNERHGLPADVVPIQWTKQGQVFSGPKPVTVQSYLNCCSENISLPLYLKTKELGLTHLIRGQRNDESHTTPVKDGAVVEGVTILQPIENWTSQEVLDYLALHMDLPEHFTLKHSSMDCYDCTAFRAETRDRVAYTRDRHPALHQKYLERANAVDFALSEALK